MRLLLAVPALAAHAIAAQPAPQTADLTLRLNLASFRLDAAVGGTHVGSFHVAIGLPKYPTPTGSYAIRRVEWNPWWIPPESDWARHEKPTPPGPDNPMGRVKLHLQPLYYLHGSPFVTSIGHAASHGCVRLANVDAIALAQLVHRHASPELSAATLDSLARDTVVTRAIVLAHPVPVTIVDAVWEVRRDTLWLYPRVYRSSPRLTRGVVFSALATNGVDTLHTFRRAVDRWIDRTRRTTVGVPLDSLRAARESQ